MNEVITIGVDLAKNVFQVHGVDAAGETVIRRQLRRSRVLPFFEKLPGCLVGMEACATAQLLAAPYFCYQTIRQLLTGEQSRDG